MIAHRSDSFQGPIFACFIGRREEFAAQNFTEQYEILLNKFATLHSLAYTEQLHGDHAIEIMPGGERLHFAGEGDALYTCEANTGLLIRTADCIPILFYSKTGPLVGAVHAGWRGLQKKILTKVLQDIRKEYDLPGYSDLQFVVGPFIGEKSYQVGGDVAHQFDTQFSAGHEEGKFLLNLRKILEAEFESLTIEKSRITWYAADTLALTEWYSARRGDERRNLAVIWREGV